ncbi:unnamed protein product [Symbiodinium pilosum]|uniref:Uncharacterized protein n=1 Tax=Symbiodinium pilosum TaxID=2952 RepID=A0A812MHP3_SYMPI|nr:unnamed protein product [Symbiodinium pilosum]
MYSEQEMRMRQQLPYGTIKRSERSACFSCCDKVPESPYGNFPDPKGMAPTENGYFPLGMGPIPVAPSPKGAPFPMPVPGGQSSGTYGGYGVNPFHTGAGSMGPGYPQQGPHGQYGHGGYQQQKVQPFYSPGGYYGHGAMNSLVQRGYYPTARPGRSRKGNSCC